MGLWDELNSEFSSAMNTAQDWYTGVFGNVDLTQVQPPQPADFYNYPPKPALVEDPSVWQKLYNQPSLLFTQGVQEIPDVLKQSVDSISQQASDWLGSAAGQKPVDYGSEWAQYLKDNTVGPYQEAAQSIHDNPSLSNIAGTVAGTIMKKATAPLEIFDPALAATGTSSYELLQDAQKPLGAVMGASTAQPNETMMQAAQRGWEGNYTFDEAAKWIDQHGAGVEPYQTVDAQGNPQAPWFPRDAIEAVNPLYWATRGVAAGERALGLADTPPPAPDAPIEEKIQYNISHPSNWMKRILGVQDTIGGNYLYDPMTALGEVAGPKGETFLATGAGEEFLKNANTAGNALVSAMGPEAQKPLIDFVQQFSRTAFRGPGERSLLSEILPVNKGTEARGEIAIDMDWGAFNARVKEVAKREGISPEFLHSAINDEVESAILSKYPEVLDSGGPVGYTNIGGDQWQRNPMPEPNKAYTSLVDEAMAVNEHPGQWQPALDRLAQASGNPQVQELYNQWGHERPEFIKDKLLRMVNDPLGIVSEYSDAPLFEMKDVPVVRWQAGDANAIHYDPQRGGAFFSTVGVGREEKTMYAGSGDIVPPELREGGEHRVVGYVNPDKPYVVNINDLMSGMSPDLYPRLYPDLSFKDAYENLDRLLPFETPENIAALRKRGVTAIADRLVAEKVKEMGHDSIFAQDLHGNAEVFILDPEKLPTPIPDIITQAQRSLKTNRTVPMDAYIVELAQQARDMHDADMLKYSHPDVYKAKLGGDLGYLPHYQTPEAKDFLDEYFRGYGPTVSPTHKSQLERSLKDIPISAINRGEVGGPYGDAIKQFLAQNPGKKFLEDNPAKLFATRARMELAARTNMRIIDDAAQRLAMHVSEAPQDWVPLNIVKRAETDYRLKLVADRIKDLRFEPDVAKHLNAAMLFDNTPRAINHFEKYLDAAHGIWKPLTLNVSPQTILRNYGGGLWNGFLGDVGLERYQQMYDLQRGAIDSMMLNGRRYSAKELQGMLDMYGIDTGLATVESHMENLLATGKKGINPFDLPVIGKGMRRMFKINNAVEANLRGATFLEVLDRTGSPLKAALEVKRLHGDYVTGLTDFERAVMRRTMPFYQWSRFNGPLQLKSLIRTPSKFVHLAQVSRMIQSDELARKAAGVWSKLTPDWVKDQLGIPVRKGPDGKPEYFLLGGWVPANDMDYFLSPKGLLTRIGSLVSPVFKLPAEIASNRDLQYGNDIEKYPGENGPFLGIEMRKQLSHALKYIRPLKMLDQVLHNPEDFWAMPKSSRDVIGKAAKILFGITTYKVDMEYESTAQKRRVDQLWRSYHQFLLEGNTSEANRTLRQLKREYSR